MPIIAAAAIPAVLALGPLRRDVERSLGSLPPFDAAVLLASGSEPMLHDVVAARAPSLDVAARNTAVTIDTDLLTAIVRRGQAPRVQSRTLDGALGVLALHLDDLRGSCAIVPMTVPDSATAGALDGVAVGLEQAIRSVGDHVVVIAAGDLAGPPGEFRSASDAAVDDDAARRWDEQAAAAIAASDLPAFRSLGPDAAQAVDAAGWASLCVFLGVLDRAELRVSTSTYEHVGGAGRIVATATPTRSAVSR